MKTRAIASIVSILLAACGGNASNAGSESTTTSGSATIGGTIAGVSGTALLVNNGTDTIAVDADGGFTFDRPVPAGAAYNVTFFPETAAMTCTVGNGTGTVDMSADAVTNIAVTCQGIPSFGSPGINLGVTVSGLASGNAVTFLDNGANPLLATSNGLVVFPFLIGSGPASTPPPGTLLYSVSVSTNPIGQVCTLGENATPISSYATSPNFVNVTATCR